ncbi:MAG: glycoside hydrolase family 2 protein [Candidatus Acidiferrum sp.]
MQFSYLRAITFTLLIVASPCYAEPSSTISLHGKWQMQSSCTDKSSAETISSPGFVASKWHEAEVPGTVVAALVADKSLPDPYFGMNLKNFPGVSLGGGEPFSNREMPPDSPYRCSFWFRTEFATPANASTRPTFLHFLGINYRANIWLNGKKIADRGEVAGAYRSYEFPIGNFLRAGANSKNALAVEIFAPEKNDLGLTWVDWNPTPPDKDMGIWREVFLSESGEVALRAPFATSKLSGNYASAELTLSAELRNTTNHLVQATLHADFEGDHYSQAVQLAAEETKTVMFSPDQFPKLKISHPQLWWPYQMGDPFLYTAKFRVDVGKDTSDASTIKFGIREVSSELTAQGGRLFKVNGRKVLIRGAAWTPDMLLRWNSKRVGTDLAYVRHMGLNTVRLEGKVDREEFFDATDRLGILVMPGFICCDMWEHWDDWTAETKKIAAASLTDQITRLRTHPSVFVWLYGSDNPPPPDIENMYLAILKDLRWPNPSVSSASETATKVTGPSGVKMTGPYEYVPPVYWLADTQAGGAFGYNTETSPGPAIPTKESLAKFIPVDHLWPIGEYWNFHAGGERFTTVDVFTDGLNRRYGAPTSLDDYERKAQASAYDNERAMFEAYGRNKYVATGVIQWMLNNAWPSIIWHLYDYYLVPGGGYFGTKKAQEIVHVQYDYTSNSVSVVNGTYAPIKGLKVNARLFNIDSRQVAEQDASLDIDADSAVKALDLPKPANLSTTYFLKLELRDGGGFPVSDNFYWLSTKPDTMDWANKKDTVYTPQKEFGDLTGLNTLQQVKLETKVEAGKGNLRIRIKNPSSTIAFQVHLRLADSRDNDDIVPIFWDDNYFSLLPGEERSLSATFDSGDYDRKEAVLKVNGFNIQPVTIKLSH